jgi:uncharacterized membrane protein YdjX (TVP38/TMEM64 family)
MEVDFLGWLPLYELEPILLAGIFFVATAALVALCVPGVLLPIALSSGALLGAWEAAAAVALGAVAGSQLFFLLTRRYAGERLRRRLGKRFEGFRHRFAAHGLWYLIALRLVGAPHLLVAGGSALMPIRASRFALATLIGLLPAIAIAAATGSAL